MCQRLLAPLASDGGSSLRETFDAYLRHSGNSAKICDELFIHRNTLSYRLRKIEELLKLDLSDGEVRATCMLALGIVAAPVGLALHEKRSGLADQLRAGAVSRAASGAAFPHAQDGSSRDGFDLSPSSTRLRSCTAVRPISSMGERTEDSGMGSSAAREVSLNPTTATSRPTLRPWDRRAPIAPMAAKSLTAKSAVGRGLAAGQDLLGRLPAAGRIEAGPHHGIPRNGPAKGTPAVHEAGSPVDGRACVGLAGDHGDVRWPLLPQVAGHKLAAEDVVAGGGREARHAAVHEHERHLPGGQLLQQAAVQVGVANNQPVHPAGQHGVVFRRCSSGSSREFMTNAEYRARLRPRRCPRT